MKCLLLDEVMMEIANFNVGVCLSTEKFVNDQDLDKAIRKVLQTLDGVENLSAEQRDGIVNFICSDDVLAVFNINGIREIIVISINSWTLCWTT